MKFLLVIGRIFKTLSLVVLTTVFSLLLILSVLVSAISLNITNQETVKSWLIRPEVYEAGVDLLTNLGGQDFGEEEEPAEGTPPAFDEETVRQLQTEIFHYQFYERAVGEIIDGIWGWLNGETDQPEFSVQITEDREQLLKLLVILFTEKIEALPACPPGYQLPEGETIFGSECRPADYDPDDVSQLLAAAEEDEQLNQLFASATISSDQLDMSELENPEAIPTAFQFLKWLPVLALVWLASIAWLIVLTVYNWRRAVKLMGGLLTVLGGLLAIAGAALFFLRDTLMGTVTRLGAQDLPPAAAELIDVLTRAVVGDMAITWLIISGTILAVGAILLSSRHIGKYLRNPRLKLKR